MSEGAAITQPTGGVAGAESKGTEGQNGTGATGQQGAKLFTQEEANSFAAEAKRKAEADLVKTQGELERLRQASMTADEKKLDEAKKLGQTEAAKTYEGQLREARLENAILAAGANPALKASILEQVAPDGDLGDLATLKDRIAGLFEKHPYFALQGAATSPTFPGGAPPAGGGKGRTFTRSEVQRAIASNEYFTNPTLKAEIKRAEAEGRITQG